MVDKAKSDEASLTVFKNNRKLLDVWFNVKLKRSLAILAAPSKVVEASLSQMSLEAIKYPLANCRRVLATLWQNS